jgi:hypothetical protein
MPLDEILRNSAPAIGGLLVAAAALACARFGPRSRARPPEAGTSTHHPAE